MRLLTTLDKSIMRCKEYQLRHTSHTLIGTECRPASSNYIEIKPLGLRTLLYKYGTIGLNTKPDKIYIRIITPVYKQVSIYTDIITLQEDGIQIKSVL